jgi:phosphoribosyl 1,2-cyclic phosphodiesterase
MAVQFAVLASGSRGNVTLIRSGGAAHLLDLGIGPRSLAERLQSVGSDWDKVTSALLTHTHGDHVNDNTLLILARRRIPFYCHEGHRPELSRLRGFRALEASGLVRTYDGRPFLTTNGLRVEPVELRHDGPTFGFRFEAKPSTGRGTVSLGYMADTGSWSVEMAELMAEVDLLGLEFNHDVDLQRRSGRHPALIARNLGDQGHLSNVQAADFLSAVFERSGRNVLRHLVLLHLSQQCNRPELAVRTARAAIRGTGRKVAVHAARQEPAHPNVWIEPVRRRRSSVA